MDIRKQLFVTFLLLVGGGSLVVEGQVNDQTAAIVSSSSSSEVSSTTTELYNITTANNNSLSNSTNSTDSSLYNLLDINTTTPAPTTPPLLTTPVFHTKLPVILNGTSPQFMGWPDMETELPTTTVAIIPPTRRPEGTIACPLCTKSTMRNGQVNVTCRDSPVWCDQYGGCWYYTDVDGHITKGCMDIIPKRAGFYPTSCSEFYKHGFCVREQCLSCDLFGVGGSGSQKLSVQHLQIIITAVLTFFFSLEAFAKVLIL